MKVKRQLILSKLKFCTVYSIYNCMMQEANKSLLHRRLTEEIGRVASEGHVLCS